MLSIRSHEIISLKPDVIPILYSELRFGEYFQAAIVTVLCYDTITTMDKEVKYFWSNPRNSVSLIYFANRYIGIFSAIVYLWFNTFHGTDTQCAFTNLTAVMANWVIINMIDYILLMRVLALFSQDRRVAACLRTLFALEAASMLGILIYVQVFNGTAIGALATTITVCETVRSVQPVFFVLAWTIPLVYECLLMVLALYKAASFWRMAEGFSGFNLVKVLIQDQAIYFVLAIFCNVAMVISDTTTNPKVLAKVFLGIVGSPSLLCVLGSRLLVHLKEAGEIGVNEGTSYRTKPLSNIAFA